MQRQLLHFILHSAFIIPHSPGAHMKKHLMPEMKEGGVNVTPLIDIVMCLIIFFMLVAKIGVTSGADERITPPETLLGSKIEDMGNTITLNVRDWDKVYEEDSKAAQQAGKPIPPPPTPFERSHPRVMAMVEQGAEPRPLAVITPNNDRELRRVLTELVKHNSKLRVIIRADADIKYDLLQQVLIDCSMAKVKDFNFETKQRAEMAAG
jgi:biopolymer transport protein ExbD